MEYLTGKEIALLHGVLIKQLRGRDARLQNPVLLRSLTNRMIKAGGSIEEVANKYERDFSQWRPFYPHHPALGKIVADRFREINKKTAE